MEYNLWTIIFIIAVSLFLIISLWLSKRQKQSIKNNYQKVPNEFSEKISLKEHQKAGDYTLAKLKINNIELVFSILVVFAWTLFGGLNIVNTFWQGQEELIQGTLFMVSVILIGSLIDIPFNIYRTFILEEKFGFNKTTMKTFIIDLVKSMILSLVFLTPILYFVLYLMANLGEYWWFFVWLTLLSISIMAMWIYPTFISPLFNKFTPLKEGELKQKIKKLLSENGFNSDGVFVMDGSKRSSHGNAYFTGFGKSKRIVFFDTLLKGMTNDEIIAILAHELGHFHHKHIRTQLIVSSIIMLISLAILGFLMKQSWFFSGLGVESISIHMALMLFLLTSSYFTFFITPIMNGLSRKNEFEADNFASKKASAKDLISSLIKLYKENSATLTPDKYYSLMHDSHPNASLRIANLNKQAS
ncbi:CAAX prenyl protease 1, putative [hydrothermal vent metagenome]|uniref:CAAX prenyl protease 1, putative n=1 Tax=hydrothermal vent metagenome TaxID=652676 RepID=A0A1W1BT64_9ZZZZ